MLIRSFYWHDSVIGKRDLKLRKLFNAKHAANFFTIGNCGDIITEKILEHIYGATVISDRNNGKRILCTGSIAHKILDGDLLCGIGAKFSTLPSANSTTCYIHGLRGPISYELFKKSGHDVNDIQFMADPGLLLRKLMPAINVSPQIGKVLFIPHYKERYIYKERFINNYIEVANIDSDPVDLGHKILEAECVLSSSLHGIIFSHSLNRPCTFILPQTDEPMLKFIDYFESVNIAEPNPLKSVNDYTPLCGGTLPSCIDEKISSIKFPTILQLTKMGIV